MAFRASDGHLFHSEQRARKYQDSLVERGKQDIENAPGGTAWEHDRRMHGPVRDSRMVYDGPGRWKVTAKFADGYVHQSVHPEKFRGHQVIASLHGIDAPPPGVQTQQRARAHPSGPREQERLDREDKRVVEREPDEDQQ